MYNMFMQCDLFSFSNPLSMPRFIRDAWLFKLKKTPGTQDHTHKTNRQTGRTKQQNSKHRPAKKEQIENNNNAPSPSRSNVVVVVPRHEAHVLQGSPGPVAHRSPGDGNGLPGLLCQVRLIASGAGRRAAENARRLREKEKERNKQKQRVAGTGHYIWCEL